MDRAPDRATLIGATIFQLFTKTPGQWREPEITEETALRFRESLERNGIRGTVSHDSYLINLASPDNALRKRSIACFTGELDRCALLGIDYVVTHPGNYISRRADGLRRNAAALDRCLANVPGPGVLVETTAGSGTALGSTFEELAELRDRVSPEHRNRIAFCADTCHLYSAGYDLRDDFAGVLKRWDEVLGLDSLKCLHLNDSLTPFGSRRDRHALIGEGSLGPEPFRKIMSQQRFRSVFKIIETPKGDDPAATDRRMLRRLRAYGARRATTSRRRR